MQQSFNGRVRIERIMTLWFNITFLDTDTLSIVDQELHGPFENADAFEHAINEKASDATSHGEAVVAVPVRFELCTDDVPELISSEEAYA